jgi:hypothetical protein
MLSANTSIKILILLLWLGAIYFFVMAALSIPFYANFFIAISFVAGGLISVSLVSGFVKREEWAWYSMVIISIISFLFEIIYFIIQQVTIVELVSSSIVLLVWIALLLRGSKLLLSNPKENIKRWFLKPGFLIVVISYLVIIVFATSNLVYSHWYKPQQLSEELESPTQIFDVKQIEKETENWESYRGEQIGISLKYPKSQEGLNIWADEIPRIMDSFSTPGSIISFYNSRYSSFVFRGVFPNFFRIDIIKGRAKQKELSFEELINLKENDIEKTQEKYNKEKIMIDNIYATRFSYIGSSHYKYSSEIYLLKNNDIYLIKIEFSTDEQNKYSLLADKILATIKFIEINKNYCEEDKDCHCAIDIDSKKCSCGNVDYLIFPDSLNELLEQCPDFYNNRKIYRGSICVENECKIKKKQ